MNQLKVRIVPHARTSIGEEEIAAVTRTLRSGWLTSGPVVAEFEEAFSRRLGDVHSVATNSNTMGQLITLKALGIGPGDEVIVPTTTFVATAMSAHHLGAKIVPVDIDPITLNIDPARIEEAITPRTRLLLPVHLGGLTCDMKAIQAIAARHDDLQVVEDAAHALLSSRDGHVVGAGGSAASVFSFYATKSITCGEGGMVTTRDPALAARLRILRHHGIDRDAFNRQESQGWGYDVSEDGYKANMTDISASIGLAQLAKLDAMQTRRTAIAHRYLDAFADLPLALPALPPPGDSHAWHLFIVRLRAISPLEPPPMSRDSFISAMQNRGVQCGVHYIPLHRHSFWQRQLALDEARFPVAEATFATSVTLPLYAAMSDDDVDYVIETVRGLLSS